MKPTTSYRKVTSVGVLARALGGLFRRAVTSPRTFRQEVVTGVSLIVKATGAPRVRISNVDHWGLDDVSIQGTVNNYDALVVAALCRHFDCRNFFEIGTYLGETTWLVAHNNPDVAVYTLDLPSGDSRSDAMLELTDPYLFERWDRGVRFADTPERDRIVQLLGDSASFNYSPYRESIDMVFIDGSHSYSYVRSDTEAALQMLSPKGAILWHDYPAYPGVWAYLNELGKGSDHPIWWIKGTGLAVYTRRDQPFFRQDK